MDTKLGVCQWRQMRCEWCWALLSGEERETQEWQLQRVLLQWSPTTWPLTAHGAGAWRENRFVLDLYWWSHLERCFILKKNANLLTLWCHGSVFLVPILKGLFTVLFRMSCSWRLPGECFLDNLRTNIPQTLEDWLEKLKCCRMSRVRKEI